MIHDAKLLLWLRIRHLRTECVRLFYVTGSDILADKGLGARLYQVYAFALVVLVVGLLGAFALDALVLACAGAGTEVAATFLAAILVAGAAVCACQGVRGLRASLVHASYADVSYILTSSMNMRAILAVYAGCSLLWSGAVGGIAGGLAGIGIVSALAAFAHPFLMAGTCAALMMMASGAGWVVGMARFAVAPQHRRCAKVAGAVALACLVVLWACAGFASVPVVLDDPSVLAVIAIFATAAVVGEVGVLMRMALRVDMCALVQENALFAELQPFGALSPLGPLAVSDARRRRKVARRPIRFHLPEGQGCAALISRAWLSLVRQPEGLLGLSMLGCAVTPLGVFALLGTGGPMPLLFWLSMLVMPLAQGPRVLSQAFRDDMRVRLVRDQMPQSTLVCALCDGLLGFALASAFMLVTLPFIVPVGVSLVVAYALGAFLNVAVLVCGALDAIAFFPGGPRPWNEAGLFVFALVVGLASFSGIEMVVLVAAASMCVAIALVVHGGTEVVC